MKLGILGCGAIGSDLARFADREPGITALILFDQDPKRAADLAAKLSRAKVAASGAALIDGCDLLAECASQEAARVYLPRALGAGKSVLCLSMGALADDKFRAQVVETARSHAAKIYLPSGAVCAVDGLKAAAMAKLTSVTLVTTKPPVALGLAVNQWTVVYDGSAREAVRRFPQNVNVAAALSLAGLGFDQTRVQIVADPLATRNQHKVIIEGEFGRVRVEVENLPSPSNPKTSFLASLSAIATLKRLLEPVQLGA